MTSFTETFGGSAVSPADVAYAAYSFGSGGLTLYWPSFSNGNPSVAARFMSLTATTSSSDVTMPDATLNSVGYDAIVFNAGSNSFNIVTYNGNAIVTIAPGQTYYLILNNNATQDGSWQVIQFGVGTGSAVASQLAGPGLMAFAGLLQVNLNAQTASNNFTITQAGLGQLYVWNGGSGTITLPAASSVGNGFFFILANNGSGSVTLSPSSGTIDGNSTSIFGQTESGFIMSNGSNWYTVGKGIQNTFSVTLLNLNVAGGSNVTETSSEAQNIIQNFTGLLTANIDVIVPATVQLYIVSNNTTGSFTLTMKTASGTGQSIAQGSTAILYCDGVNVLNAFTATISGSLVLNDGSAISPSLSFTAQPGTGLYSAGSNTFSATANTTQVMQWAAQASAVNYFGCVATATGAALTLGAVGSDANINISILPKGSGYVTCGFLDGTVVGSNVPEAGSFTTLSASSTVSGSGFSTYLASPPAIGGTAPGAITGTTITSTSGFVGALTGNVTGNLTGNVTGTINATSVLANGVTATTQSPGDSSTLVATDAFVAAAVLAVMNTIYPVGGIYSSTLSTNPATLLGFGTWSAYAQGLIPIGVGTGTDINGATLTVAGGATGGEYGHTLIAAELPVTAYEDSGHFHLMPNVNNASGQGHGTDGSALVVTLSSPGGDTGVGTANISNPGGGGSHNNVQPYIGIYMWKRTA